MATRKFKAQGKTVEFEVGKRDPIHLKVPDHLNVDKVSTGLHQRVSDPHGHAGVVAGAKSCAKCGALSGRLLSIPGGGLEWYCTECIKQLS